jgi:hypothetical protein
MRSKDEIIEQLEDTEQMLADAQKRIAELEAQATDLKGALIVANKSAKRRGERIAELQADAERLRREMDGLNKRNAQLFDERNEATDLLIKAQQMLETIAAQRQKAGE